MNTIFDYAESIRHRDIGMEIAADHNATILTEARDEAVEIAKRKGTVTADDVVLAMMNKGYGAHALGNSAGSLFRDARFEWTKERIKSTRIYAHGNEIKVWRLK